ncbi:MAG: 23S rRNA (pseudouridine(1915)-N(3))-methyltransferase RlmH [Oscillospiraceae bacterium]|jgi:23S rRNA (pseudouridine1915-N3)-methyltransferase|nr:23S rRNA (pseudouridine(1915)-N(3))-methyltransferase RlmH [Oscillospiraceae bacterium]
MRNLTIISVGKLKEKAFAELEREYETRLSANFKAAHIELKERGVLAESVDILARIPKNAFVCALCVEAAGMSSEEFSRSIMSAAEEKDLCFIIGGSDGLDESVKKRADLRLSLSPMTLTHTFARVVLAEQIYRAVMIKENRTYHK